MFDQKEKPILEAKHVTRIFSVSGGRFLRANNDINLKLYRGRTLGIVGESGCGKSTLMRMFVQMDQPTEGEIFFAGKNIASMNKKERRENRRHIQMVFQDPSSAFNPKMKIKDIICEPLLNFKMISGKEKDAEARRLLRLVELPEELREFVIVHELCHLVYPDHGEKFHALVNLSCGGKEKEYSRTLRKYSHLLKRNT